ncbi:hypothetical protein M8994_23320, partial [Brucella sp. 21LCYQ03]|nr:hypothetical protein [Brucella sp. 21LCYQ03]
MSKFSKYWIERYFRSKDPEAGHRLHRAYERMQRSKEIWDDTKMGPKQEVRGRILQQVRLSIDISRKEAQRPENWRLMGIAASLLVIVGTIIFTWHSGSMTTHDIAPGGNHLELILTDGTVIQLDSIKRPYHSKEMGLMI